MDSASKRSTFSENFLSLQLQLKTLLEDAGGDDLLPLLDACAVLSKSEKKLVLGLLERTVRRIADGAIRLETAEDKELKAFEENLFRDLSLALDSANRPTANGRGMQVLDGGKAAKMVDLTAARRKKLSASDEKSDGPSVA